MKMEKYTVLWELVPGDLTAEWSSEEWQELTRWENEEGEGYQRQAWKDVPGREGSLPMQRPCGNRGPTHSRNWQRSRPRWSPKSGQEPPRTGCTHVKDFYPRAKGNGKCVMQGDLLFGKIALDYRSNGVKGPVEGDTHGQSRGWWRGWERYWRLRIW